MYILYNSICTTTVKYMDIFEFFFFFDKSKKQGVYLINFIFILHTLKIDKKI